MQLWRGAGVATLIGVLAGQSSARADLDLTGRWGFSSLSGNSSCFDFAQVGTALSAARCDAPSFVLAGMIDLSTGAFTLTRSACGPSSMVGAAALDGQSMTMTLTDSVLVCSFLPMTCNCFTLSDTFTGMRAECGDGYVNASTGEQCDDGNALDGDCCSSTCQYEASGSPCADSDPCTVDTCDGAGHCGQLPTSCKIAGKSLLLLKNDATDDTKDKLLWKWLKGAATTPGELGNPSATTNYTLCLYAGTASAAVALPAGSKWQAAGTTGFKFKDPSETPDGAQNALLKSGAAGNAKALVKGKGTNLPDSLVGVLQLPVTAQLVNDTNNVCVQSVYNMGNVIKNDGMQFNAKTP